MLTSLQSIVTYQSGRAVPDRLTRKRHGHYLTYARQMLAVYRSGIGRTRRDLHQSIQNLFAEEPECQPRRIAAFCKLLDDASQYEQDLGGQAAQLRVRLFTMAARYHPLVTVADGIFENSEQEVKNRLAAELGLSWEEIDRQLYADVIEFQRLKEFGGYADAGALLSRYNVAQLQACLYRAVHLRVTARKDFKRILRYAKLSRLLHEVHRLEPWLADDDELAVVEDGGEYHIDLSGPASVLRQTRRYGVNFARFVPVLLACRDWRMEARVGTPWGTSALLQIGSADRLSSHLAALEEFDSSVEADFAAQWGTMQQGWRLIREGVILHEGQNVFFPDFVFRREDGAEAFLEIVGFWTPEYLAKKRETLQRFRRHRILIAVARRSVRAEAPLAPNVIVYRTALQVQPVLEALNKLLVAGC